MASWLNSRDTCSKVKGAPVRNGSVFFLAPGDLRSGGAACGAARSATVPKANSAVRIDRMLLHSRLGLLCGMDLFLPGASLGIGGVAGKDRVHQFSGLNILTRLPERLDLAEQSRIRGRFGVGCVIRGGC